MPTKKITKKKVVSKPKKTTKKAPKKKVAKKAVTKKTTRKPAKKATKKVAKNKVAKKKTTKKSTVKKTSIKDLIQEATIDLELSLFVPEVHFSEEINLAEVESPMLFLEEDTSIAEAISSEYQPDEVVDVMIKRSNFQINSQHVLDLSESELEQSKPVQKQNKFSQKDLESFMLSSDEDGFWHSLVEFMQDSEKTQSFYNFLNISFVSLLLLVVRTVSLAFYPIANSLIKLFSFLAKGFVDYVKMLFNITRLTFRGQLNRDNLLNPEQALIDVALFDKPILEPKLQFSFSPVAVQSLALFIILSMVVILPVKGMALIDGLQKEKASVLGVSEDAYSSLQLAVEDVQQFSWATASQHFQNSRAQFAEVYNQFQDSHTLTKKILQALPKTKNKIETADHLIQVGIEVSDLGEKVANLLNIIQSDNEDVLLTGKIRAIQDSMEEIHAIQARIAEHFVYIDIDVLPEDIQGDVTLLRDSLPKVFSSLNQIEELMNFAYIILGGDKQQTYLLAFQNSDELRATGGFMGSLTTATIYQGKVIEMDTPGGGPYDWQAWLTEPTVAPKPLWLVNPVWQFQDANWFVNFPTSADKILNFYNQTKSTRVDGVIAINSYVLPEIIRLTGDIELPEYDKVLTPDNVLYELQEAVELEYDLEENKPKKIIGDLFSEITNKLLDSSHIELIDMLQVINNGLLNRDIQMYFTDPSLQSQVHNWRWSGEVQNTNGDYMMVVNSNIGGAKTDKFMNQESILDSYIQPDGSIVNELTIRRTNNGIPGDIFYGHNNVDYLRVYVPEGSELIEVVGDLEPPSEELFEQPPSDIPSDSDLATNIIFDSYDESGVNISTSAGKTVFGLWLQTNLNETSEVKIRYTVPVEPIVISTESDSPVVQKIDEFLRQSGVKADHDQKIWYSMYWQKQSGHHNHNIDYTLHYPKDWTVEHTARPGFVTNSIVEYKTVLEQDFSTGFLFGNNE